MTIDRNSRRARSSGTESADTGETVPPLSSATLYILLMTDPSTVPFCGLSLAKRILAVKYLFATSGLKVGVCNS